MSYDPSGPGLFPEAPLDEPPRPGERAEDRRDTAQEGARAYSEWLEGKRREWFRTMALAGLRSMARMDCV